VSRDRNLVTGVKETIARRSESPSAYCSSFRRHTALSLGAVAYITGYCRPRTMYPEDYGFFYTGTDTKLVLNGNFNLILFLINVLCRYFYFRRLVIHWIGSSLKVRPCRTLSAEEFTLGKGQTSDAFTPHPTLPCDCGSRARVLNHTLQDGERHSRPPVSHHPHPHHSRFRHCD
jgi:hypothetical protein